MTEGRSSSNKLACSYVGCSRFFTRQDRLTVHLRTHTGERPFACHLEGCQASYLRRQHLVRHMQNSHSEGHKDLTKLKCPHCELELVNTFCLKKHVNSFHNNLSRANKYRCSESGCDESFCKKKQLLNHKLNKHADSTVTAAKYYSCTHEGCGRKFVFPNKLKLHMKLHQGYTCPIEGCSQILPTWSSLRRHRAVAHVQAITCTECGAVFKHKSNWTQHVKRHSTSHQSYPCPHDDCSRVFLHKKNLRMHIRVFHDRATSWTIRTRKKYNRKKQKKPVSARNRHMAARLSGFNQNQESKEESPSAASVPKISENERPLTAFVLGTSENKFLPAAFVPGTSTKVYSSATFVLGTTENEFPPAATVPETQNRDVRSPQTFDSSSELLKTNPTSRDHFIESSYPTSRESDVENIYQTSRDSNEENIYTTSKEYGIENICLTSKDSM